MEKIRDYSKFFTPSNIAKYLASLVTLDDGDVVLEPSAGDGSIVRAIKQKNAGVIVFAFDINNNYKAYLRNAGANIVIIKDFLSVPVYAKFTSCIANPPFGNGIDLKAHFDSIRKHVKTGGEIAMILPDDFDVNCEHKKIPLENWSKNSDGTTTKIKIVHFIN